VTREVVLITGASSDIGLALVERLVALPEPPVVLAHSHSGADRIPDRPDVHRLSADFSSAEAVSRAAESILADHGCPSQFVHLPGLKLVYERFSKFKWEHFEKDLRIQVQSAVILLRRFLPLMAKMPAATGQSPRVVFVLSSVTRGVPPKFLSMYTIVKHAQLGLMRALASEYAEAGVSVNAVSPGMVETKFLDNIPDTVKEMSAAAIPRRRNARPDDVVNAIEFLLSPKAGYLTGVELPVTGGAVY
jgi:3-oxoacyl-[acyl-carrier protein] reductase